jgi:hypothetical protein
MSDRAKESEPATMQWVKSKYIKHRLFARPNYETGRFYAHTRNLKYDKGCKETLQPLQGISGIK